MLREKYNSMKHEKKIDIFKLSSFPIFFFWKWKKYSEFGPPQKKKTKPKKQNKTQSKAKQSKAKQSKAKQNKNKTKSIFYKMAKSLFGKKEKKNIHDICVKDSLKLLLPWLYKCISKLGL